MANTTTQKNRSNSTTNSSLNCEQLLYKMVYNNNITEKQAQMAISESLKKKLIQEKKTYVAARTSRLQRGTADKILKQDNERPLSVNRLFNLRSVK